MDIEKEKKLREIGMKTPIIKSQNKIIKFNHKSNRKSTDDKEDA